MPSQVVPSRSPRWVLLAAAVLLSLQAGLAVDSLLRENPTVDEVAHLPAGISYWKTGSFKLYPHNPPLVRLLAALSVLATETGLRWSPGSYLNGPYPNTSGVAHEFAEANARRFFELFANARLMMPAFLVIGGLMVFLWSRTLHGDGGGLLSLTVWAFCPNLLAHGRLITTDVAATSLGFAATFGFWRYLRNPTRGRAAGAGLLLGLAELAKFSNLLLYALWPLIWVVHEGFLGRAEGRWRRVARYVGQGGVMVALSVLVIDLGYGFEGVGTPLGSPRFEFASRTLTRPAERTYPPGGNDLLNLAWSHRVNRFRGTPLADLPSPLPVFYWVGFDLQKLEAEGIPKHWAWRPGEGPKPGPDEIQGYPVYLDGTLRQTGWWYYYVLALAYKVPEGTIALVGLGLLILAFRGRTPGAWVDELTLLSVPTTVLAVMSLATDINLGLRYVLPIFPYLFTATGKVVPWAVGLGSKFARRIAGTSLGLALGATIVASALIHPHYLAYFNAASGGPARGSEHLIDSNLDWGQDLINLREWLRQHGDERVGLAYFGQINPGIFALRGDGFDWFLPPARPGAWQGTTPPGPEARRPPVPGLYAVSASLVRGLDWRVYAPNRWAYYDARHVPGLVEGSAFGYFRELTPIDKVGFSIFVYRLDAADCDRLARHWDARRASEVRP